MNGLFELRIFAALEVIDLSKLGMLKMSLNYSNVDTSSPSFLTSARKDCWLCPEFTFGDFY